MLALRVLPEQNLKPLDVLNRYRQFDGKISIHLFLGVVLAVAVFIA